MIVGTAGHIDHGKTLLVKAITGVDADRLQEEKARGITIDLGFAYWPQADGSVIGFVDVPGHERFVHTMLAGAQGIDLVLLVVAADDGVMPQTREHVEILHLLGVSRGLVALTKADLVDQARLDQVSAEISAMLATTSLAGAEILPVSSLTGHGLPGLLDRLRQAAAVTTARDSGRGFRLAVDRAFTLAGAGTVVTGMVLGGTVATGDQVLVSPSGLEARVRGIHAQNQPATVGQAGQRCALNLAGPRIAKEAITRGDMVLTPALHAPTARIDAELTLSSNLTKPLGQWMPARFHHATVEVGARIVPLDQQALAPGTTGMVQLVLERPIAAAALDRFILRDVSAQHTIGGGRLLDLRAPDRRRRTPERQAIRAAWAEIDDAQALNALLAVPPGMVELDDFIRDRGRTDVPQGCDMTILTVASRRLGAAPATLARFDDDIVAVVRAFHAANPDLPGPGIEQVRQKSAKQVPAPVFRLLLQRLADAGVLALDGGWVRAADHLVTLDPLDEEVWREMVGRLLGAEQYRPPRVRDFARAFQMPEDKMRRLCKRLMRAGRIYEVAHDHFFHRDVVASMFAQVRALAADSPDGWFVAAKFRDRLDNGRKVAIQILEYFDRQGATVRRGDRRRPNPHRLDLFGAAMERGGEAHPVVRPDFKSGKGR